MAPPPLVRAAALLLERHGALDARRTVAGHRPERRRRLKLWAGIEKRRGFLFTAVSWKRLIAVPLARLPGLGGLLAWLAVAIGIHFLFREGAIISALLELLLWLALLPAAACFAWTAARKRG